MAATLPSDAKLKRAMEKLVLKVDVDSITTKQFIAQLSQRLGGVDLSKKKKFIKMSLGAIIDAVEEKRAAEEAAAKAAAEAENDDSSAASSGSDNSSTEGEESEEESEEEKPPPKKKAKKQAKGGTGGGGGLAEVKDITPELAEFLGRGPQMSRTGIVKALWEYIREHDLQNPEDRREIILDDAMQRVFGAERFNMFQMNKYVGAHIHPFKPVDLESTSSKPKKKPQPKPAPKKKKGGAAQRKPNAAFQAPYRLSEDLARVCGTDILPRTQVTKHLWDYIRKNNLQNPEDKRQIICDENFKIVMDGEETVTMFTMNKYISKHLIEKVDASLYHPPVQEEKKEDTSSSADTSSGSEDDSDDGNKTSTDTDTDDDNDGSGDDDDGDSGSDGENST